MPNSNVKRAVGPADEYPTRTASAPTSRPARPGLMEAAFPPDQKQFGSERGGNWLNRHRDAVNAIVLLIMVTVTVVGLAALANIAVP